MSDSKQHNFEPAGSDPNAECKTCGLNRVNCWAQQQFAYSGERTRHPTPIEQAAMDARPEPDASGREYVHLYSPTDPVGMRFEGNQPEYAQDKQQPAQRHDKDSAEYLDAEAQRWCDRYMETKERLREVAKQNAALRKALEQDRTTVADGVTAITNALKKREWLRLGRGSYEWDDDRWKEEFGEAYEEILEALSPLRKVASNWQLCSKDEVHIKKARAALEGSNE